MFTVYFVDDDILIINELKSIIDWKQYHFEIVGYNIDPVVAKEEILQKNPTLVISDVQMDGLNGLMLAESIRQQNPHITFVFLSAYDKFDYAVEAIRLGAIRYIKKPLKKEQLINLLVEIDQKNQSEFNEQVYNNLMSKDDNIQDLFDHNQLLPKGESFNIITINGNDYDELIKEIELNSSNTYCFYKDEHYVSLIAYRLNNYQNITMKYPHISSGISPLLKDYSHFAKLIRMTRIASKQKFLTNKDEHVAIKENNAYLTISNQFKDCEQVFDLQQLITRLKETLIEKKINVYYLQHIYRAIVYALVRFNLVEDEDIFNISVLDEYENIDELISDLLNYFVKNENNDFSEFVVNEVKNELINNIDKKISLSFFADKYGYNISYFSQLFKKVVGTSFAEYFILLKMDKAKSLIINSSMSLQSIASAVGYDDYYHFSKMFKKYTQYSPTEFKSLYLKK